MKVKLCMMFLVVGLLSIAHAQTTPAAAVATVKARMLDPDSFVLTSIAVTSCGKVKDAVFMTYRSHNRMGGYSPGCATVGEYKGKSFVNIPDGQFADDICESLVKTVTKDQDNPKGNRTAHWLDVKDFK